MPEAWLLIWILLDLLRILRRLLDQRRLRLCLCQEELIVSLKLICLGYKIGHF